MKIAVAADHGGYPLKAEIMTHLSAEGHEVTDLGCNSATESVDYPDYAVLVARAVVSGSADFGIALCGTGIGISIAANKISGVRAALVHDLTTARLAREHNNANVLCLGARTTDSALALACVDAFLKAQPEARHQARLDKITALEQSALQE
jgi:ribose 5-phosphate isomerase B